MRGDRPTYTHLPLEELRFTPHARGSTSLGLRLYGRNDVYPACAGIDPLAVERLVLHGSLPRMRGDRPNKPRRRHQNV